MGETVLEQRTRMYRVSTLASGVAIHLVACWIVMSIGGMSLSSLEFLALASVSAAGFLVLGLFVAMEWNLAMADPDLSLPQMLWAVSVVVVSSHFVEAMKPVVLLVGVALMLIGANRLGRREQMIFAAWGMLLYMASLVQLEAAGLSFLTELVVFIAFALVIIFGPLLYQFEMSMADNTLISKNRELSDALDRIRELAITDELTGAFNRRHLIEHLAQLKAQADRREEYRFSLCYVDLDFFKRVNDRFGHGTGDDVLRGFADAARSVLREVDCVARIGGEEFVLALADTSQEDAVIAAGRLASRLGRMQVSSNEPQFRITASVGISEYRMGESVQNTMDRADRALYEAKRTGRNKVIIADPQPVALQS